jgi:uncharacterized protein (UPF0335 family)
VADEVKKLSKCEAKIARQNTKLQKQKELIERLEKDKALKGDLKIMMQALTAHSADDKAVKKMGVAYVNRLKVTLLHSCPPRALVCTHPLVLM